MLAGELIRKLLDEGLPEQISYILDREGYPFLRALLDGCPRLRELLASLLNPEVLDRDGFYQKLKEDLQHAAVTRIEVYSPFLHLDTVKDLGPDLRDSRADEKVVYTRPPEDIPDERRPEWKHSRREWHERCVRELKELGLRVEFVPCMHEKAVVIGERVAYVGSANVLSRWDERGEVMLRFEGPFVGELIRDLKPKLGADRK